MESVERKRCECGCQNFAPLDVRGQPLRYIHNHHTRGHLNGKWKGGRIVDKRGYVLIKTPDHLNANSLGYVREHILIVEKAIKKYLPKGSEVHHLNEDPGDNRNENLVLCNDRAYHELLHQRQKALRICGHANWLICHFCHEYDDPANLKTNKLKTRPGMRAYHPQCMRTYRIRYWAKNRDHINAARRAHKAQQKEHPL